jgi:DNA-binding winged helix-turn-helix (wHTH) protein
MDDCSSTDILLFDGFRFERRRGGCLYRLDEAGAAEPVPLCGRALALLGLLLERRGELVLKDEIMSAVWRGRVVEEANLNVQIAKLRRILDQDRGEGSCIQTISGYGYRFVASVTRETRAPILAASDDGAPPRARLLIIVLSMAGPGEERIQRCFAGGIPGNLTIDLSLITDILAISHDPAAVHRDGPVEIKQVGRAEEAACTSGA